MVRHVKINKQPISQSNRLSERQFLHEATGKWDCKLRNRELLSRTRQSINRPQRFTNFTAHIHTRSCSDRIAIKLNYPFQDKKKMLKKRKAEVDEINELSLRYIRPPLSKKKKKRIKRNLIISHSKLLSKKKKNRIAVSRSRLIVD